MQKQSEQWLEDLRLPRDKDKLMYRTKLRRMAAHRHEQCSCLQPIVFDREV